MRRRQALGTLGAVLVGGLAGCGTGTNDSTTTATTATTTRRTTRRPTETATPTPTRTATPSPTPTAAPEPVTHELGERFVVDEGGEPFAYTVHGLRTAERILMTSAPEGTRFVVVDCTAESLQGGRTFLPTDDIWLRASDVRRSVGVSTSSSAAEDPRIDRRSLAGETFIDVPIRGVFAFAEVPTDPDDYALHFTPPGTTGPVSPDPTLTHRIGVGSLGDLERIE